MSRHGITAIALLVTSQLLLLYGLPGGVMLTAFALLVLFYFRAGALAAVATTLALALATLMAGFAIHLLGLDKTMYYRPHEQLVQQDYELGFRRYKKNAHIEMVAPHGDLGVFTSALIGQPRKVVFQTDGDGFRNDRDYAAGDTVLIGDSFVVGMADSQADTLSAQLSRDHQLPAYNLGHPGDIADYLKTWRGFVARHGRPAQAALFLFEGNDFDTDFTPAPSAPPGWLARWGARYYDLFTDTSLYRVTRSLYTRAIKSRRAGAADSVRVVDLAGHKLGLYMPYVAVTERPAYTMPAAMTADLTALAGQVDAVFFVPTKYRVYARHLGKTDLPNAQWQALSALCKRQGWRCADLTPALTATADAMLKTGQLIWWPDDSHWNRNGIAVAAEVVAERLRDHAGH